MTAREKRLRFEGRKISKEAALADLGDPRTWASDARAYAMKIRQPYEEAVATPREVASGERKRRSRSQVSTAEMELAAEMIPNMLAPTPSLARYALVRSAGQATNGPERARKLTKKTPSGPIQAKRKTRKKKK